MKKITKRILALLLSVSVLSTVFAFSLSAQAASVNQLRSKVVSIAQNEVGYRPKVDNVTKYGEWYGYQGPWCTTFAIWVFNQADKAMGTKMYGNIVPSGGSSSSMKQYFVNKGNFKSRSSGYRPQAGDWIFFNGHVGIVKSCSGSTVYTIEGNVGRSNEISYVGERSYSLSNSRILGYGVPDYSKYGSSSSNGSEDTNVTEPSKPVQKDTAVSPYKASVNAGALNVRKQPTTSSDVVKQLSNGDVVTVTAKNGDWVKIDGGYVMSTYLTKVTESKPAQETTSKPTTTQSTTQESASNSDLSKITSVRLTADTDQLKVGESVVLNAAIKPFGIEGKVEYMSKSDCIKVDQKGNVTALAEGEGVVEVKAVGTDVSTKYTFFVKGVAEETTQAVVEEKTANAQYSVVESTISAEELAAYAVAENASQSANIGAGASVQPFDKDVANIIISVCGVAIGAFVAAYFISVSMKKKER